MSSAYKDSFKDIKMFVCEQNNLDRIQILLYYPCAKICKQKMNQRKWDDNESSSSRMYTCRYRSR